MDSCLTAPRTATAHSGSARAAVEWSMVRSEVITMLASCKNKSERMLAVEVRKLAARMPALMARFNLEPRPPFSEGSTIDYVGHCSRYNCGFRATPIMGTEFGMNTGRPWLACCFDRPSLGVGVHAYLDIGRDLSINTYSGKYNCHTYGRHTAREVFDMFAGHLCNALGLRIGPPLHWESIDTAENVKAEMMRLGAL